MRLAWNTLQSRYRIFLLAIIALVVFGNEASFAGVRVSRSDIIQLFKEMPHNGKKTQETFGKALSEAFEYSGGKLYYRTGGSSKIEVSANGGATFDVNPFNPDGGINVNAHIQTVDTPTNMVVIGGYKGGNIVYNPAANMLFFVDKNGNQRALTQAEIDADPALKALLANHGFRSNGSTIIFNNRPVNFFQESFTPQGGGNGGGSLQIQSGGNGGMDPRLAELIARANQNGNRGGGSLSASFSDNGNLEQMLADRMAQLGLGGNGTGSLSLSTGGNGPGGNSDLEIAIRNGDVDAINRILGPNGLRDLMRYYNNGNRGGAGGLSVSGNFGGGAGGGNGTLEDRLAGLLGQVGGGGRGNLSISGGRGGNGGGDGSFSLSPSDRDLSSFKRILSTSKIGANDNDRAEIARRLLELAMAGKPFDAKVLSDFHLSKPELDKLRDLYGRIVVNKPSGGRSSGSSSVSEEGSSSDRAPEVVKLAGEWQLRVWNGTSNDYYDLADQNSRSTKNGEYIKNEDGDWVAGNGKKPSDDHHDRSDVSSKVDPKKATAKVVGVIVQKMENGNAVGGEITKRFDKAIYLDGNSESLKQVRDELLQELQGVNRSFVPTN